MSMSEKKVGLVLGKFAPFHKGHQYLLETALAEMNEVIVIIYHCPETTAIPLSVRSEWIHRLYPSIHIVEAKNSPKGDRGLPDTRFRHEEYIRNLLEGKKVTHFFSSEPYSKHMSDALHAAFRLVDPKRENFPISGTMIRQDPFGQKAYVHPSVFQDLLTGECAVASNGIGKAGQAE